MVLPCKAVTDSSVQLSVNTEFSHEIPFHSKMWKHCQADLRTKTKLWTRGGIIRCYTLSVLV